MSKRKSPKRGKTPTPRAKRRSTNRITTRSNAVQRDGAKSNVGESGISAADGKFLVVGIGASAGGLEALKDLLANMPPDTGMAFVVVTHQHPGHTSMRPELLGKTTLLPVQETRDGVKVEPNHVYIGPAGNHLAIFNGVLHHMEIGSGEAARLPIDYFFRSLAADQKEKAICIVMSGTGTDGTTGLRAVKAELGMVMVQEAQSAKYAGMPSSAIATGLADFVLATAAMPEQLVAYARGPYLAEARFDDVVETPTEPMQKIFVLLRVRANGDFVHVDLSVSRIQEPESIRGLLLVTFRPSWPQPRLTNVCAAAAKSASPAAPTISNGNYNRRRSRCRPRSRSWRPPTRSSIRPTRSCNRPMKNYRAATKSWKPRRKRCSRSTKS